MKRTVGNRELYMDRGFTTSCRIDHHNCISAVGNAWQATAEQNQVAHTCAIASLQGKPVFEQFADAETRMTYAKIYECARSSPQPVNVQIHCDAPSIIRILEARISPLANNHLEVGFPVLKKQTRDPFVILDQCGVEQRLVTMCSYCGNSKDFKGEWQALERETSNTDLFCTQNPPKINHGMCPYCAKHFSADVPGPDSGGVTWS